MESFAQQPKALAAKIFFEKKLLAREALLMSGYSEEDVASESTKKHINKVVLSWFKNGSEQLKIAPAVKEILELLRNAYDKSDDGGGADPVETLEEIFGESNTLTILLGEGRLVPRPMPEVFYYLFQDEHDDGDDDPTVAKKQRTA